eukprot:2864227-Amphidinium_carterae.1
MLARRAAAFVCRSTSVPSPSTQQVKRHIKMSQVINQASEEVVNTMTVEEVEVACARYKSLMGAPPSAYEKCTTDQLAAVRALLSEGLPPYVDMSVWGPYGLRSQYGVRTAFVFSGA